MFGFRNWLTELLPAARGHHPSGRRSTRRKDACGAGSSRAAVESLEDRLLLTFDIQFDYTYDSSGFFAPQARKDILEQAAATYEARITDDLAAITPGGVDTWNADFNNPSTGRRVSLANLNVPADTIIVYVGARNLDEGLGLGGPGGFNSFATPAFNETLETRGEAGVDPDSTNDTDFALWGGTIAFDSLVNWNFTLDPPVSGQNDFYSVAIHELGHVLGFGTSDSFRNLIDSATNRFTGTESVSVYGGTIPMHADQFGNPDAGHWAAGVSSTLPGTSTVQETSMDPQVTTGSRKIFTDVDWAALDDLGWDVTPVAGPVDYGDAPDATSSTGPGDYTTRAAVGGPSHEAVANLYIGAVPDGDDGGLQNATATADDVSGTSDESFTGSDSLTVVGGTTNTINVNVTNNTGSAATLYGWVDFDKNGVFDTSERASVAVPTGTINGSVALNFATNSASPTAAETSFARFRLSTDAAAASSTGAASDGEVEDHQITISPQTAAFDTLPNFTWPATAGAVRYELEVNNVTTSTSQFIHQTQLTKTNFRPETALVPGTYSWRYRPHSSTTALPWSDLQNFTIIEKPGIPLVSDPVALDSQTGASSLPTIAWSATPDATSYYLWVDDLTNDVSRVIHNLNVQTTSYTPSTALPAGNYRAWVRPRGEGGSLSSWSEPLDFTVSAAAARAGEITSPVGSSTNAAPTIAWRPTGSTDQRLIVTDTATSTVVLDVGGIDGMSYTPTSGLPAGSYSARIEVNGSPAAGGVTTFQIESNSVGAELTRTSDYESDPVPTFGWTAVDGATRYAVWVNDVSNSVNQILYTTTETGTAWQATRPLAPGVYRTWVRAYNGFTPIGNWSTPLTFRVSTAITVPTITAPIYDGLNTLPTVAWSAVQDATSYDIVIRQNGTTVQQYSSTNNWKTVETVLAPGDYEVQVTAVGTGFTAANSDSARFTIGTTTGSLELFGTSGTITNTRPTFTWPQIDSATRYVIWVNDDANNLVATVFASNIETTAFTPEDALLPGSHRVWIRAFNDSTALTPWSPAATFFVAESTGAPVVTAPLSTINSPIPDITWTAVTGSAAYEVQVLDALSGSSVAYNVSGVTTTVHRPTTALAEGTYDVRVRSVELGGTPSAWSELYRFSIVPQDAAARPQVVTPLFGSTISGTSTLFAWTFAESSASPTYELWVSNLTLSTRPVYEQGLTANSFTATDLPAGDYRVWVRILGTGINSNWSVGQEFTVAAITSDISDHDSLLPDAAAESLSSITSVVAVNTVDAAVQPAEPVVTAKQSAQNEIEDAMLDNVWANAAEVLAA